MQLKAESESNHQRFVTRVAESQAVWALEGPNGVIAFDSNAEDGDDEGEGEGEGSVDVLPFWSDAAYAKRAAKELDDAEVTEIALFDFLFRWLPGMADDGVLAGTNWSGDLAGKEVEPLELQDEILAAMPDELREGYLARLQEELGTEA